ncbi:MAG: polysaccharide deacetylase family protein [Pirellulaceae bacterium]
MSQSRRQFLSQAVAAGAGLGALSASQLAAEPKKAKAQIAITLDLEMSAQYPRRDITEWNYEKGNLDEATKDYAVRAARLVKKLGGVIHFFCVGRVLEQPSAEWLKEIAALGCPIGNHTYDHVYLLAKKPEEIQFRFQRAPWLIQGRKVDEVIRENIRLCSEAMKARAGIMPNGFRTPGGFANGLDGRADLQQMLLDLGFKWVSSRYPAHATGKPKEEPTAEVYADIVRATSAAQPYLYENGLVEIPMSPISDVGAFRTNFWKLDWFLKAIRLAVESVIDKGQVFDFLSHPSCLVIEDPKMESLRLICQLAKEAGERAELVGLDKVYERTR